MDVSAPMQVSMNIAAVMLASTKDNEEFEYTKRRLSSERATKPRVAVSLLRCVWIERLRIVAAEIKKLTASAMKQARSLTNRIRVTASMGVRMRKSWVAWATNPLAPIRPGGGTSRGTSTD